MNHDVKLWTELQRIRKAASSILDAGALLLTVDYVLYRFDWSRLRKRGELGTAVLPDQLLQLLRPFIPSTDDFDQRFVETFSVPEMRAFPVDHSSTAAKVLAHLNTLDGLDDRTAVRLVSNKLLLDQLRNVDERSNKFAGVLDAAIAQENAALVRERDEVQQTAAASERERVEADAEVERQRKALEELAREHEAAKTAAESEKAQLEAKLRQKDYLLEELGRRGKRTIWAGLSVTILVLAAVAAFFMLPAWTGGWRFLAPGIAGMVAISLLPEAVLGWDWLASHSKRLGLYAGALLIWFGLMWGAADPSHRWAGAVLLLSATVPVFVSLLDRS